MDRVSNISFTSAYTIPLGGLKKGKKDLLKNKLLDYPPCIRMPKGYKGTVSVAMPDSLDASFKAWLSRNGIKVYREFKNIDYNAFERSSNVEKTMTDRLRWLTNRRDFIQHGKQKPRARRDQNLRPNHVNLAA